MNTITARQTYIEVLVGTCLPFKLVLLAVNQFDQNLDISFLITKKYEKIHTRRVKTISLYNYEIFCITRKSRSRND